MKILRILIIDDHPLMRRALKTAVIAEPDIEVVGTAADGLEAQRVIAETEPDMILVDLLMPFGGPENIAVLRSQFPALKILVVTSVNEGNTILQAIQAGAQGYITKEADHTEILTAIRTVGGGNTFLPPDITALLVASIQQEATVEKTAVSTVSMTPREQDVFTKLGEGLTNTEIAEELTISEATVRVHLHNIINKYNFTSRSQAVAVAIRHRWDGAPH